MGGATNGKDGGPSTGFDFSPIDDGSPADDASFVWLDGAPAVVSVPESASSPLDGCSAAATGDVAVVSGDLASGAVAGARVNASDGATVSNTASAADDVNASANAARFGAGAAHVNTPPGAPDDICADAAGLNATAGVTGSAAERPLEANPATVEVVTNSTVAAATTTIALNDRRVDSPRTAMESISFILRAVFRVRSKRDESIFPFIGIAYVVAKLGFLAATVDDVASRVLYATVVELFSTPINALKFMEHTFQVASNGLHLGGRLKKSRHVSGQPGSFRAADFNAFFNPQGKLTQWLSRALCLREAITFRPGTSHGPGELTRVELDSLATRLLSQASSTAAATAGCRVLYCKAADGSVAVSEVVFAWDFQLGVDDRINTLLRTLRPKLLKSPPQILTQARLRSGVVDAHAVPPVAGTSRPSAASTLDRGVEHPVDSQLSVPATQAAPPQLEAVSAAARERATPASALTLPAGGHSDGQGPIGSSGVLSAPAGQNKTVVVAPSAGSAAGIAKRTSPSKGRGLAKFKGFTGGKGKKPTPPSGKGKTNKQRTSRLEMGMCLCGSDGVASGGASWIVAEVRRVGQDVLLGMAVGVQLSWATDTMIGGRLDLSYCLSPVTKLTGSSAQQYVLSVNQTDERTSSGAASARFLVSQLPTVQTNYMSLDFASVVERQCEASCADSAASRPAISSGAVDALDPGCDGDDRTAGDGPSNKGGQETLPDTRQQAPLGDQSGSPVSRNVARETVRSPAEGRALLKMVVVDAPPDVSPLALTISFCAPTALSPEQGTATRTPGRLVLFFPVNTNPMKVTNRC